MTEPTSGRGHLGKPDPPAMVAPELPYAPPRPKHYHPRIAVLSTGGITKAHLDAYRTAGWEVAALWNRTRATAEARAAEFYPDARIAESWEDLLADPSIDVVDITPHPQVRVPMMRAALQAGKHVLSQKPMVLDLQQGRDLVALAEDKGVYFAVNQNGRWAPHLSWMREAVHAGLIGELLSCHVSIHWDHTWVTGTSYEGIDGLVLYDFAVHWFDFLVSLAGSRVESVIATEARVPGQRPRSPFLAQALVRMTDGQASFVFDGSTQFGQRDTTFIAGTEGSLKSDGSDLEHQKVTLTTAGGQASPALIGCWFNDGFRGTMGELLSAIEEGRTPRNSARENLQSLALCFAAMASAREGCEIAVGEILSLDGRRA